jgi:hypothetical protein
MDATTTSPEVRRRNRWLRLPERLPDLRGTWLTAYTIIWAIMLPLALVGAARGAYIILTTPTMWGPYGLHTTEDSTGIRVIAVIAPVARAAGVEPGDYVIAVDGWAVPAFAARASARPHVVKPEGSLTTFSIRKADGETRQVTLLRSRLVEGPIYREAGVSRTFARMMAFSDTLLLPALFISAAVLLFIRRRREAVPALLSLAFLMFAAIVNGGEQIGLSVKIIEIVGTTGTMLLFAALLAFPSGRFEPQWTAIPFLLLPINLLFEDSSAVGFILGAAFTILTLAALVSRYRKVGPDHERLQLRWAFLGLVVGMLLSLLSIAGAAAVSAWQAEDPRWVVWDYAFVGSLGVWSGGVMALGLVVSILRYRLYDADTVIGRSAAFAVLTLGFVALFAASQKLIELLGEEYLGQNMGALAGGIGAALAAVAIAPMHARIHRWAERRFQKALFRLRHGLPLLVGDLRETSGLDRIAAATLDSLVDGVRAQRATLLVGDQLVEARGIPLDEVEAWRSTWVPSARNGIECDRSDSLFPVRVPLEAEGHGRVGWLLLGPRPDGSLFGKAERNAIEEVAEPVARAVQVALSREEREARYERRFEALEKVIAHLTNRRSPSVAG